MKYTNVKVQGVVRLECIKKNGSFAELKYGDVFDSTSFDKEQFERSIKNGQLKAYLEAGWIVKGEKKVKIIGAPADMVITDAKENEKIETKIINEADAVATTTKKDEEDEEEEEKDEEEEEKDEEEEEKDKEEDPFL